MSSLKSLSEQASGLYPVLPGMNVVLGDYGYWEKDMWRYMGNIKKDFGRIEFTEVEKKINQPIKIAIGAEIKQQSGIAAQTLATEGLFEVNFHQKNSLFFQANLSREIYFPSLEGEIKRYLLQLDNEKLWNNDYWIAVSIFESDNFVSLYSNEGGVTASVSFDSQGVGMEQLELQHGSVSYKLSINNTVIRSVVSGGQGEQFAGAKFIKFDNKGLFRVQKKIKYMGEGSGPQDESVDFHDCSIDELY